MARASGTSVDALRALLPNGATSGEAAAKRMGAMDPALKLRGGRVRAEMLRDPDSPYRAKLARNWTSPKRIRAARRALRALWDDPAWRAQQTQKILDSTGTMTHRILKAVMRTAPGQPKLSHADLEALVARQQRKFRQHESEVRTLVLAEVQERGLTPMGRPAHCVRARRVLDGRAAGDTYEVIGAALGLSVAYLRAIYMPKHLKQCEGCRAYKATLANRSGPAIQ